MSGLRKWHLLCPNCEYPNEVFHMDWTSLKCSGCGGLVEQNEWKDVWEMEDPDPHPADAVGEKPLPDEHIDNEIAKEMDMSYGALYSEHVKKEIALEAAIKKKPVPFEQELIEVLKDLSIQINTLPDRLVQAMEYKLAEHNVIAMSGEEENDEQL